MPWTNASIVLNSRDATAGTYNNLKFNANGQNIIQGQIHSISVNEVNFPFDIPNVNRGPLWNNQGVTVPGAGVYNSFEIVNGAAGNLLISVPPGFYTGDELANEINTLITDAGAANTPALLPAQMPTFTYDQTNNIFAFHAPTTTTGAYTGWYLFSPYSNPPENATPTALSKDLITIMGFPYNLGQGFYVESNPANPTPGVSDVLYSGSAPLVFTQYIDICSPLLCQYQYFRDGTTTNLARRSDVICRLYVSNSVAIAESEGQRPFVIDRQFYNARVMRWNAESSVGQIDIALFDDCGQPLTTVWTPRPYQITFNCYEADTKSSGVMGQDESLPELLRKFASYVPRNEMGWNSPNYPMR